MILLVTAGALALAGLVLAALALRALADALRLLRRRATPIADLVAGPVELTGVLRPVAGPHLQSRSGTPCVARVYVQRRAGRLGQVTWVVAREVAVVPAVLEDATGSCGVVLDGARLLAGAMDRLVPGLLETEWVVPQGAVVTLEGTASPDRRPGSDGRLVVHGSPGRPLVVSVGREVRALVAHESRAFTALVLGVLVVLVAGSLVAVELVLETLT